MYKSIKIYTRTRCQVSVYRTTGTLGFIFSSFFFYYCHSKLLQQMVKVIRVFCWHQKFVPKGFLPLPQAIYRYKNMKNVYKIRFWRDHFETCNIWAKRKGLSVVIKTLSPMCCLPLLGAIYMRKNMKNIYKIRFKEIVLKLATNGQW